MGIPHILIRFSGCNLRCVFKDSVCDTPYSSHNAEKGSYSLQDAKDFCDKHSHINYVMITGGEPTIHKEQLKELNNYLQSKEKIVTIETNGTRKIDYFVDLMSISPKLQNSYPKDNVLNKLHSYANTYKYLEYYQNNYDVQFKFVISDEESLKEVDEFIQKHNIQLENVYLMPEGINNEQLASKRQLICEHAIKKGYNYTDRLHIIIYGEKRDA